ncbi:hypothetical protein [Photobacterium damselae]|uniref:hypothetical protein n=1 Tax=Photobacterium damselae TaxID=38293 RepID=UPI00406758DD
MCDLKLEPDELLNEAIMSGTPVIIVEGIDDIQIYEQLAESAGKEAEIYAAENIKGITEGCKGVINTIELIREAANDIDVENYVLGIIDADTRHYLNKVPTDNAIMILKWYSMESHFVTEEATSYVIKHLTRASGKLVTPSVVANIHDTIKEQLFELYLISIEALRNACEKDYKATIGYSMHLLEIKRKQLDKFDLDKEKQLYSFAQERGIDKSWENLLKVCSGKWLFLEYCYQLKKHISSLPKLCEDSVVTQCQFCLTSAFKKCLYRMKANYDENQVKELILSNVSNGSFDYVQQRISSMV